MSYGVKYWRLTTVLRADGRTYTRNSLSFPRGGAHCPMAYQQWGPWTCMVVRMILIWGTSVSGHGWHEQVQHTDRDSRDAIQRSARSLQPLYKQPLTKDRRFRCEITSGHLTFTAPLS